MISGVTNPFGNIKHQVNAWTKQDPSNKQDNQGYRQKEGVTGGEMLQGRLKTSRPPVHPSVLHPKQSSHRICRGRALKRMHCLRPPKKERKPRRLQAPEPLKTDTPDIVPAAKCHFPYYWYRLHAGTWANAWTHHQPHRQVQELPLPFLTGD